MWTPCWLRRARRQNSCGVINSVLVDGKKPVARYLENFQAKDRGRGQIDACVSICPRSFFLPRYCPNNALQITWGMTIYSGMKPHGKMSK